MKQPDPIAKTKKRDPKTELAKKKANRKDSEGRSGMGYTETSMDKLNRIFKNPQNSKVTSNLPSVNNSWRRDFGSYLTKPQESYPDSSGKTGIRDFEPGRDPKYVWKDARDAAAKKDAIAGRKANANRTDAAGRSGFGAGKPRPKESDRMVERSSNVSEYMYDESTRKKMKRQGK
jgi:hypothetical protein